MTDISRKYWTLAIFIVVIITFCYVAEYLTQQLAAGVKKGRPRPRFQQVAPVSPSLTSTNTNTPAPSVVGRRFR